MNDSGASGTLLFNIKHIHVYILYIFSKLDDKINDSWQRLPVSVCVYFRLYLFDQYLILNRFIKF